MPKKRLLVTGGAGFIGFHLLQALHQRGDFCIGLDNFNTYYSPALKNARLEHLKNQGIEVVRGDVKDFSTLVDLVEKHKITHLVHLAAQAGVRYSLENPKSYLESNIDGFLNILETCRKYPHLKLTYASSSSVFGNNTKTPFSESDRCDDQASLYGVTKKCNELMASTYHHLFKIPSCGLRFFTVYGPWGRPDMAYYSFTEKILRNEPIQVYNNGHCQRDFTYIDDIIQGTLAAIDLEPALEVFNLGNNQPVPLLTFIETLEKALGKQALKEFLPHQKGDVTTTYADISHSANHLNFSPTTSLEEGLKKFVSWHSRYSL